MTKYEVWTEGFTDWGCVSKATFHGKWQGFNFKDAVKTFYKSLDDEHSRSCIDLERMTFWGCKFFDNETDARKLFG